jgi:endoglucanase
MILTADQFPLTTSAAQILDAHGTPVRLCGVNWGGAQQDEGVPYSLNITSRHTLADRIAGWGMNSARIPFAVGGIMNAAGTVKTAKAPAARVAAQPDAAVLAGMTPWEVTAQLVDDLTAGRVAAGKPPMYCILNQHLLYPGWCCDTADNNGLHYNDNWPASTFFACWQFVARRFADNPYVGYDLHNEWRAATIGGKTVTPTWGTGDPKTDARLCYQQAIDKIRAIDPGCLCFCEGLSFAGDLTGWGGARVGRGNTVASLHDYSWFHSPLPATQAAYDAAMDAKGGYLVTQDTAPLWIGEFGASTDVPDAALTSGWLPMFISWAARRGVSTCWWELGATGVLGTQPATNTVKMRPGQREAFSPLAGQDWGGTQTLLLDMLAPLLEPLPPG